ncbi:DUF4442 domain-containing protein [Myroides sp. LJL115]
MNFTVPNVNRFLFFKLPSAYWSGVRLRFLSNENATTSVRFKWFNQNPFKSMYFAVQAMAAELSTGVLVMQKIQQSDYKISMLVLSNKSSFTKKAVGVITFKCNDGLKVDKAIKQAIESQEAVTFWMQSIGRDHSGEQVSQMEFEWTVKVKPKRI